MDKNQYTNKKVMKILILKIKLENITFHQKIKMNLNSFSVRKVIKLILNLSPFN